MRPSHIINQGAWPFAAAYKPGNLSNEDQAISGIICRWPGVFLYIRKAAESVKKRKIVDD
jgi:hypothetical protein